MRQSINFGKVLSLVVALLFPLLLAAQSASNFKEDAVPVVCPAIDQDEQPRTDYPYDSNMPISLVAMGNVRRVSETNSDRVFELTVERVIYGTSKEKTVRFSNPWNLQETQHVIVALVPIMNDEPAPFELRYDLPGAELKSQVALARARLDYRVLSAECIFIGKDASVHGDFYHTVEIVRSIYGTGFKVGQKLTVQIGDFIPISDRTPQVSSNEMIYLIRSTEQGNRLYGLPTELANEKIYTMSTRLDVDQENNVREALKRRDSHPMVEVNEAGKQSRCREVMFDGDDAEAISLLGSTSDAAVTLGVRKLKNIPGSLSPIVAAVEKDLFDFTHRENNGYRRLHNLIRLLEDMGQGSSKGEIGKLLDKLLSRVETAPPSLDALPKRPRFSHYWTDEEEAEDVNHALAWLMMGIKEDDVIEYFAHRAIDLRNKLSGSWKAEVQLALEAASVEDNLELQAAKAAARKAQPLRIAPAIEASGQAVAFSHDGRFLACGNNVWKTEDWSKAGGLEQDGSIEQVSFSKDDKLLYVVGGAGVEIHKRFDWKSGKLDKAFDGHKFGLSYIALTPDNRQMLTASAVEGVVHLWDIQTEKIVKSWQLPARCYSVALSPNGLMLARQTAPQEITVEPLSGGSPIKLNLSESDELCAVTFSPDGTHFFAATFGFASELSMNQVVHLLSYDVAAGFKLEANTTQAANRCTALAVSSDSKQIVFGDQEGRVWAASAPDLKTVRPILVKKGMGVCSGGIAFSPNGKVLVVGSFDEAIHIFDAHTLEPIQQRIGHSGRVKSVYFSNDGKTLESLGRDDVVCRWDLASGKMLDRFSLPKGTTCISVRGPDGRYALCASALDVETPFWDQKKKVPLVKVVDLSTGKVVSEVDLPVNWSFTATGVLWLREPEALCLADGTVRRFNYLTGKLIEKRNVDIEKENLLYNGVAYVADDGKTLYTIGGGYRGGRVTLEKCDADIGKSSKIGEAELPRMTGNSRGLVPGGKYFFIADPGIYIYERNPVQLAAQKRMKGLDLLCVSFSPQGDYYAVAAGARREVRGDFTIYEPAVQTVIRVQETLTGKTVFAFPAHSRWVKDIQFSPDAKQLAVVTDDGFIEIWKLNSAKP